MAYIKKANKPTAEAEEQARIVNETIEAVKALAAKTAQGQQPKDNGFSVDKVTAGKIEKLRFEAVPIDKNLSRIFFWDTDGVRRDLGAFPNPKAVDDIESYPAKLFREIGDRIKQNDSAEAELYKKVNEAFAEIITPIKNLSDNPRFPEDMMGFAALEDAIIKADELTQPLTKNLTKVQDNLRAYYRDFSALMDEVAKLIDENSLYGLFVEEVYNLSLEPEYKAAELDRLSFDYEDEAKEKEADTPHNKALHIAWDRAGKRLKEIERLNAQNKQDNQDEQGKQDNKETRPVIKVERKDSPATIIPVDKVNSAVWKMLARANTSGQYEFDFVTGKPIKKGQRVIDPLVMYSLDFDKIEKAAPETAQIVKHLTPYDKRVMIAVAALYNAGNEYFTITDIWHKMGNAQEKRPAKIDFEKINSSLKKQSYAHLVLNNMGEQNAAYNYPKFHYEGELLQFEKVTAEIDGQPIESAIHLFREPPLVTFARDRKQITTVKNAVLESPVSKTEQNLQIDDYLIERIAAMKREPKNSRKILYKTLFDDCGITRNQSRAKETIERYLKHYKATDFVKDFQVQGDCIIITP